MSDDWRKKIRSITAREIISALERDGFRLVSQSGSHKIYRHPDTRRVAVSFHHPSDSFPRKTLNSMLFTQAKWTLADLERLGLI